MPPRTRTPSAKAKAIGPSPGAPASTGPNGPAPTAAIPAGPVPTGMASLDDDGDIGIDPQADADMYIPLTDGVQERLRRWRLALGQAADDQMQPMLSERDLGMDNVLEALYGANRRGGLGGSKPNVARWLGDIRTYFPASVVQVIQRDAIDRLGMQALITEPELLDQLQPDVHLVSTLLSLKSVIPEQTKATARAVVRKLTDDLLRKLQSRTRQAIVGSINRAARSMRPRHADIDWHRTIKRNLKHYQPTYQTIIPASRVGFGRKRRSLRDVVLLVDQSGSMAPSVVYSSIFAAVMASLPAVSTQFIVFDTAIVDLTHLLADPVDVLFGTRLGGGTDINLALGYAQQKITRPSETILVLISDLYEGGDDEEMKKRIAAIHASGVQMVCLLALDDCGTPSYSHDHATFVASLGIPCFGCTPDHFPDLMSAVISRHDIGQWAAARKLVLQRAGPTE